MMVCKPYTLLGFKGSGYEYQLVNIHSKLALFDDTFAIIGSANLNTRSMVEDAEAVIGTTQLGLASSLRRRLFTGLLGTSEYNNDPVNIVYGSWDKVLKNNWKNQHKSKALMGTASFFYDDTVVALPNLD